MTDIEKILRDILSLITITIVILIFTSVFGIIQHNKDKKYKQSDEYKRMIETQANCEHNYVTTGSGSGRGLKVYAKCSKCGKIIK